MPPWQNAICRLGFRLGTSQRSSSQQLATPLAASRASAVEMLAVEMELRQPTPPSDTDEMELAVEVQLARLHGRSGLRWSWIEEQQSLPFSMETQM